jgi:UDP-glucose 4-epimerase
VIKAFEKVSGQKLPYKIVGRGDITSAYANTDKANNILGWSASSLEESMVVHGSRK